MLHGALPVNAMESSAVPPAQIVSIPDNTAVGGVLNVILTDPEPVVSPVQFASDKDLMRYVPGWFTLKLYGFSLM